MNLRDRIQRQVFCLNGLLMNEFDLSQPPDVPGLFGPDSVMWRVHDDFTSMMCGGTSVPGDAQNKMILPSRLSNASARPYVGDLIGVDEVGDLPAFHII